MTLETVSFEGHECVRLHDGGVTVMVTTSVGPRVLGLTGGEGNVMAVLPGAGLERPDGGRFSFIGGHRLWAAPEIPEVTYQPDDRPCAAAEVDGGVRVEAPTDGAGSAGKEDTRSHHQSPYSRAVVHFKSGTPRGGRHGCLPLP